MRSYNLIPMDFYNLVDHQIKLNLWKPNLKMLQLSNLGLK